MFSTFWLFYLQKLDALKTYARLSTCQGLNASETRFRPSNASVNGCFHSQNASPHSRWERESRDRSGIEAKSRWDRKSKAQWVTTDLKKVVLCFITIHEFTSERILQLAKGEGLPKTPKRSFRTKHQTIQSNSNRKLLLFIKTCMFSVEFLTFDLMEQTLFEYLMHAHFVTSLILFHF